MSEINNLTYFLNSIKDLLPFKDEKDFKEKINENKDFRIKVQKLVYLSKYFGWDNGYHFNFHIYGPYSTLLSEDYSNIDLSSNYEKIPNINMDKFKSFIKNQNTTILEAESTILYYSYKMNNTPLTKNDSMKILKSLKPHISRDNASKSFDNIIKYNLFNKNIVDETIDNVNSLENIVNDKAKGLMDIYETFSVSSNRLFILGSLDYFRIVLQKANLNDNAKLELLNNLYDYAEKIEKDYFKNYSLINEFAFRDLTRLKNDFDKLEKYVSDELKIIPKFDETSDLSMFF